MSLAQRLWRRVAQVGNVCECWIWLGSTDPGGYGKISIGNNKLKGTHRVAYEDTIGPIPDGLELDHLCRQRICCNPYHLEPVTREENNRRAGPFQPNSLKTKCQRGHDYSDENTAIYKGKRYCRTCERQRRELNHEN